jgi:hypothetical protein
MSVENLRELIKQELPALIREDQEIQELVLRLARREFASRAETQDRFYELLNELRKDRAEYRREFDQVHQKFDQVHEEFGRVNKEFDRVHEELGRVHEEFGRVHEEFGRVHEEIMALAKKYDRGIGALGARWGLQSEAAFRNALAGILEESFKVQVLHITPLKVQKYNIENQWLETSLDDLPHSQVRRSIESDRGESGSYVESPSGHL